MTRNNSHGTPIDSQETYEFRIVCKTCGVVGSVTLFQDDACGDVPIEHDPAKLHYERTGHNTKRVNYTTAPDDIIEMLDTVDPADIDFDRITEWLQNDTDS